MSRFDGIINMVLLSALNGDKILLFHDETGFEIHKLKSNSGKRKLYHDEKYLVGVYNYHSTYEQIECDIQANYQILQSEVA
jgi:hypothetical protein